MPRVADYSIIADGWVIEKDTTTISFEVPSNVDAGSRCVLNFMFDAGSLDDIIVRLNLNGSEVWKWTASGTYSGPARFFQEVIPAGSLKGGTNIFTFNSSSDDFRFVQLSDVVVWWQANI